MKGMLKKIIIFVIVFILVIVAWSIISGKKDDTNRTLTSSATESDLLDEDESAVADTFLNTLLDLNTLTLDDTIFGDPRFQSLVDHRVVLTPQPEGRSNPYLPTGSSTTSTPQTGTTGTTGTTGAAN